MSTSDPRATTGPSELGRLARLIGERLREAGLRSAYAGETPGAALSPPDEERDRARRCGTLTWGSAGLGAEPPRLVDRLLWWPSGVPNGPLRAALGSRIPRAGPPQAWLAALRWVVWTSGGRTLLAVEGAAATPWLRTGAAVARRRMLRVRPPGPRTTWRSWGEQIRRAQRASAADTPVLISPSLTPTPWDSPLSVADQLAWELADERLVLSVRDGGRWARFLGRLRDEPMGVMGGRYDLVSGGGALGHAEFVEPLEQVEPPEMEAPGAAVQALVAEPAWLDDALTHCTRAAVGAWPGESEESYRRRVWIEGERSRTAWDSLRRIVVERRLRASSLGIRGGAPVVCWTAAPIDELAAMRVYRRHRVRWDFEPYGLRVRQAWLERHGARAVRYGSSSDWSTLADDERPFFQIAHGNGIAAIDWRPEQEWRVLGDVELHELAASDAELFVPSAAEAERLRPLSRWPVRVLM